MRQLGLAIAIAALAAAALLLLVPKGESAGVARPAFSFAVPPPGPPPAIAGEKYAGFSFCKPPPPGARQCGARYATTNPSGGFAPYTFSLRSVLPGLHVNLRTGLLFGTVPKGAQARKWSFTVCATESRTPKFQQPRTKCDETSITITRAEAPVTIGTYVTRMQREAQQWRTAFEAAFADPPTFCSKMPGLGQQFAAFAARARAIGVPADLRASQARLVDALTALSEAFAALGATPGCDPDRAAGYTGKRTIAYALMLDWADAVVEAARAKGIAVDQASLVCCRYGG